VNNTAISSLRKKKPDLRSLDEEGVLERVDSRDSSFRADGVELKSRRDLVNRTLRLLQPDDARILMLFYQAEQSLEEMAAILGVETNTAKVRLHRARTRLREKMEQAFPAEIKSLN
jgi:RNA polymerase sigma-70 factor (ECF subfamily)